MRIPLENLQLRLVLLLGAFTPTSVRCVGSVWNCDYQRPKSSFCNHLVATNFSFIVVWFVSSQVWHMGGASSFSFSFWFFCFFLFFKRFSAVSLKSVFFLLCLVSIVEGLLVNSVIDAKSLPNYPDEAARKHFHDGWQRSYSFGAIPSVSSVLLVAIASTIALTRRRIVALVLALGFIGSGAGWICSMFLIVKSVRFFVISLLIFLLGAYWLSIAKPEISAFLINKVSIDYIHLLADQKLHRLSSTFFEREPLDLIFGTLDATRMGGDFGLNNFIYNHGLVGSLFLIGVIFSNTNRNNWLGILVCSVGTLHYSVIFFVPGQMVFGYLLAMQKCSNGQSDIVCAKANHAAPSIDNSSKF